MFIKVLSVLSLLCIPFSAYSQSPVPTREMMIQQLEAIKTIFESKYAPHDWKQSSYGWDLELELQRAKDTILSLKKPSVKDFQRTIRNFLQSTRDFHVQVQFCSTAKAMLPISICGVDSRYFITYIDRDHMPLEIYPIEVGDELLELDGKSICKVIKELSEMELSHEDSTTNTALVEHLFSCREGRWGVEVPHGPVIFTVQSQKTQRISSYQILWDHIPELIRGAKPLSEERTTSLKMGYSLMAHPCFGLDRHHESPERVEPRTIGSRLSFLPPLGTVIWESATENPFQAYIALDSNLHRIGFIRIPSYLATEADAEAFAEIMQQFENETDLLVIDQLNNCGGINMFCYTLLSMLTERPLVTPLHRLSIAQDDVLGAYTALAELRVNTTEEAQMVLGKTICGYPVTRQLVDFYLQLQRFIILQWKQGKRLTDPIFLLMNGLCFSAADLFPAVLQDNHRAILFGEKTAGASGAIGRIYFPNALGIEWISFTTTIAERRDSPIEGVGITPDVPCAFTIRDLRENYIDYMNALQKTIDTMLAFTPITNANVCGLESEREFMHGYLDKDINQTDDKYSSGDHE